MQFQKEARDTQDLLKRLDTEINQKYNPDFKDQYQLDGLLMDLNVNIVLLAFSNSVMCLFCSEHVFIIVCVSV